MTDFDHANDPAARAVALGIADSFHDLDDSEDCPFGPFPRASTEGNVVIVRPDTDPGNYADDDLAQRLVNGEAPSTPVVRITVERIA
jgi:hypothetical protein